ncbi:unnamed protein product [Rotaria magnacalcarata]
MDINEEIQEIEEEEQISPIIQIFERLTFERGHEVHDQVASMVELFSLSNVTLDMLDTFIECVKIIFVHQPTSKNMRILDFLIILTHVTHINYANNTNLSLVFDALIDIFSQTMVAIDSQIRHTTFQILNKLQSFIDLSRSPYIPDQFEQYLLELLNNETTFLVLDQIIPLAAKFQHKNPQFIDAFLRRINSPKWLPYVDRRRQLVSLLEYSSCSLNFLLSTIETDSDLSQLAFESLLDHERGFTLDKLDFHGRLLIFQLASKSRDLSRLIFTQWISQSGFELIDILRLSKISSLNENKKTDYRLTIESSLRYFLNDKNIRRIVLNNTRKAIGTSKGGLLPSDVSNYAEQLFIWRILCQLINGEDDDDNNTNIHPDFHEFIAYFYRLVKSSVNKTLSSTDEFVICQHASILSTFDMLDIYRRKCVEAISRCMLVHFGQYETIIEQALELVHRIHPSKDTADQRYQLITYTLNDIIQRCKTEHNEELTFMQCMTMSKLFIEHEKEPDLNNTDLKQLLDSLIRSGLSHKDIDIQSYTLSTLRSLVCHSRQAAIDFIKKILHITNKIQDISLKCQSISTLINVLLVHGLDFFTSLNLTTSQFIEQYLSNLFSDRNIEIKHTIVFGLIKLFLSSRLEPTVSLLKIILDYRFSNDYRPIDQHQRDDITSFFYFFTHLSISNVLLIEEITFDLVSRCLPFVSDNSTMAYRSIFIEQMCSFCIELLSLPSLPMNKLNEENSHYRLAINILESIHNSANNRTSTIIKSYLDTVKRLQFQYMNKEQLQIIFDAVLRLRQYPNLSSMITNSVKHIDEQIQSCLRLIDKLTNGNHDGKRSRSPSPSSQQISKRISSTFKPPMTSSPNVLRDRTNHMFVNNDNPSSSKGTKRKFNTNRYTTLDFENDTDDFF